LIPWNARQALFYGCANRISKEAFTSVVFPNSNILIGIFRTFYGINASGMEKKKRKDDAMSEISDRQKWLYLGNDVHPTNVHIKIVSFFMQNSPLRFC
jgi:hypothetical protein